MNNMIQRKKGPVNLVLDIIIGILCVIVVGAVIFVIASFKENYSYSFEADSFYYRLEDEDYSQMVEMYYANEAAGIKADEKLQQYYGVTKYFEAASYYKVYQEAEDTRQMQIYSEKMADAQEEMGELDFLGEKICEKLGIE